ncbi:MAG: hypothetical protein ACM31O_03350 [Bacteroidota bacterium]
MTEIKLDDLMSEDEVMERWGKLLAARELREARQAGLIEWFDLRKGPHYTAAGVMAYLALKKVAPCRNEKLDPAKESPTASGRSAATGSPAKKTARLSIIAGMTPQLEERAAKALDSEI